jgi:cytochrome c-type biogenesis protein CcmH
VYQPAGPEEQQARAKVARLQAATRDQPADASHWLQLGQAYLALEQYGLAETSLLKANRLFDGKNVDALAALAEARVLDGDDSNDAGVSGLFEEVLRLEPTHPKALFYTALAALHDGQLPLARERFSRMLGPDVPEAVQATLRKQIAELDAEIAADRKSAGRGAGAGDGTAAAGDLTAVRLDVAVDRSLQAAFAARAAAGATLFVFVRNPAGGPPLAVKRLPPKLPLQLVLSAADAMMPSNAIQPKQRVSVAARLSASGSPTAQSGDLYGEASAIAGGGQLVTVIIDKQAP